MSFTLWWSALRYMVIGKLSVGGRKFSPFSLSYRRKCLAIPNVVGVFISVPYLLIVLYGPDFYYKSVDLFQFYHLMKIDLYCSFILVNNLLISGLALNL